MTLLMHVFHQGAPVPEKLCVCVETHIQLRSLSLYTLQGGRWQLLLAKVAGYGEEKAKCSYGIKPVISQAAGGKSILWLKFTTLKLLLCFDGWMWNCVFLRFRCLSPIHCFRRLLCPSELHTKLLKNTPMSTICLWGLFHGTRFLTFQCHFVSHL